MLFRHQRMDDDFKYHPEWEQYTPRYTGIFNGMEEEET